MDSFKVAKALLEAARGPATAKTTTYKKDIRYFQGLDHWSSASSGMKAIPDAWKCKGVRNYTFATIDHKAAVVLGAPIKLRGEPLDAGIPTELIEQAVNAVRHELERCNIEDVREDTYITASVGKVGVVHITTEIDALTGEHKLRLDPVDIQRFFPDPKASRLSKANYVCYEPIMDFASIRRLAKSLGCEDKVDKIGPSKSEPIGTVEPDRRTRTNDEIINAPGNEFALDGNNKLRARESPVAYVWQRDESVSTEVLKTLEGHREDVPAGAQLMCLNCGSMYPGDDFQACPDCGSPDATYESQTDMYPYGRLTIICQDQQFYDGPNLDEIDSIFPFAAYGHYRIPGEFWGFSDLDLLKSNQMQADKTISQLIDAMRLTAMGFLQIPAGEPAWANVTNEPGQKVPTRPENKDTTRWITPQGYNPQLHSIADAAIYADFQRVSGEPDMAVVNGSAPDSATEVSDRAKTRNTRIGRHLRNFNRFDSDVASISWQIMVQRYVGPRPFMFSQNGSQFESVVLDLSMFPRNIRIRVESDLESTEKDKNAAQNTALAMNTGQLPFMPDVFLRALGQSESQIKEIMNRPEMELFTQIKMNELMAMAIMGTTQPPGQEPDQGGGEKQ